MARLSGGIGKNILSNWSALFLGIVVSFFLSPYVVNKLGDAYYGLWAVLMQFTGYLNLLDFGVREAVIRNASRANAKAAERKLNRVYSVSLLLYTLIALACILISVIGALSLEYWLDVDAAKLRDAQVAIALTGATIGLSFIFNLYSGILLGLQRFDIANAVTIPFTLVRATAIVLALGAGYKIIGLALIQLGVSVASGVLMIVACRMQVRRAGMRLRFRLLRYRHAVRLAKKLLGFSVQVLISNIGQRITFASDALVAAAFLPVASVTYYAIAGSLVDYFRSFAVSTVQVFSPMASNHHALREQDRIRNTLLSSTTLSLVVGAPVIIAYIVLGEPFIGLWMGERFAAASGTILVALGIGMVLSPAHHAMASVLYGLGKPHIVARCRIVEAIANLTLSLILVQRYGLVGIALGTTIPHLILTGLVLPWYACYAAQLRLRDFYTTVVLRCAVVSVPFLIGAIGLRRFVEFESLVSFFIAVGLLTILHFVVFMAVYFGKDGFKRPGANITSMLQGEFWRSQDSTNRAAVL